MPSLFILVGCLCHEIVPGIHVARHLRIRAVFCAGHAAGNRAARLSLDGCDQGAARRVPQPCHRLL